MCDCCKSQDFVTAAKYFTRFGMIFTHFRVGSYLVMKDKLMGIFLTNASRMQYLEFGFVPECSIIALGFRVAL